MRRLLKECTGMRLIEATRVISNGMLTMNGVRLARADPYLHLRQRQAAPRPVLVLWQGLQWRALVNGWCRGFRGEVTARPTSLVGSWVR